MSSNTNSDSVTQQSRIAQLLSEDVVPWYRKKNLTLLYISLVPTALAVEMTNGYDSSVLNGLQAVDAWNAYFNNPAGAILGVMNAALSIGAVLAIPCVPFFNDRYGRKFCIILGTIITLTGSILQTASVNIEMWVVARLILGAGLPLGIAGAAQLIAELAYPKERAMLGGLLMVCFYTGSILAAGVVLGTYWWPSDWSWRLPSLIQIVPSLLQVIFVWFIPESPRWLVAKDRHEEAYEILIKYHAEGDRESEFVVVEFEQIKETIRMEIESTKQPWKEFFGTGPNRRRIFVAACVGVFSQWSGSGLVTYYLAKILAAIGITDRKTQNSINLGLSSWSFIAGITASYFTTHTKRRTQYLFAYIGMTIIFACVTAGSGVYATNTSDIVAGKAVVALIFLYYTFSSIAMPLTFPYLTELFPYIIRTKGTSVNQIFRSGSAAFNLFVNPIGLQSLSWKYYLVYVIWLCIETAIIYFVFPETQGPSLEEVAFIIDGVDAKVEVVKGSREVDEPAEGKV